MNPILLFVICIIIAFLPGAIGTAFGGRKPDDPKQAWYELYKPSFTPPSIVFPIVWSILYVCIGVALFVIVRSGLQRPQAIWVFGAFAINLILNALWSPIFFRLGALEWALVVACGLLVSALYLVLALIRYKIYVAAALLIPYAMWLFFAMILNTEFVVNKVQLNKRP